MALVRDDVIPGDGPELLIRRVRAGEEAVYICISKEIAGTWFHWLGKRSAPCTSPQEPCRHCLSAQVRKWRGYIHVYDVSTDKHMFLELPPKAAKSVIATAGRHSLRGAKIHCKRGKSQTTRLKAEVMDFIEEERIKTQPLDPLVALDYIWNGTKRNGELASLVPVVED